MKLCKILLIRELWMGKRTVFEQLATLFLMWIVRVLM